MSPTMKSMRATDGLTTPPEALEVMKTMTVSTANGHELVVHAVFSRHPVCACDVGRTNTIEHGIHGHRRATAKHLEEESAYELSRIGHPPFYLVRR